MTGIRRLHPISSALYFFAVIALSMAILHPIASAMIFVGGAVLYALLCGIKSFIKSLRMSLTLMVLMTLMNPLFVHKGETILFFINGNPVTLEAVAYGGISALMLGGVYYWFACFGSVMTDDKIVCLCGRRFPRMALVLSMTLGFVPRLKRCASEINDAQLSLGMYDGESYSSRLRAKLNVFSVLVSQSLEGSIDTADTMIARGYSLPGRSSFSRYRFGIYDGVVCAVSLAAAVTASVSLAFGGGAFACYPSVTPLSFSAMDILLYISVLSLMSVSAVAEISERLLWRLSK